MRRLEFEKMTKMSFLELTRTALFMSVVLWQVTQSISLPPVSTTVTEKTLTTTEGSTCDDVTCPPERSCELNSAGQPECVCPTICPAIEDPVCGSDGKTYGNECMLIVETCKNGTNVTMLHKGICNDSSSCDGVTCPPHKYCKLGFEGKPECVCDEHCPDEDAPVCASNGKTYSNLCGFFVALCWYDNNGMTVVHNGPC